MVRTELPDQKGRLVIEENPDLVDQKDYQDLPATRELRVTGNCEGVLTKG